jgi:NADH-quinone oxidoreductase subunit L
LPENISDRFNRTYTLLYNKYYIDEIYDALIVNPIKKLCHRLLSFDLLVVDGVVNACAWLTRTLAWISHQFDIYIVDGIINSAATLVSVNSSMWRRLQSGYLQNYAFIIVVGAFIIIGSILFF